MSTRVDNIAIEVMATARSPPNEDADFVLYRSQAALAQLRYEPRQFVL
jgi:hypothetical protein